MQNDTDRSLLAFNTAYLAQIERLAELETIKKEMEDTSKRIRKELLEAMRYYNLMSVDNDYVTITRVAPSSSMSINSKALKLAEPDLYFELEEKYPKLTERAESIRIKVK